MFALSWWLGAYLLARDPRKPVLVLAATGLCGFAAVVALEAIRMVAHSSVLSQVEIYLATVPASHGSPCSSSWAGRATAGGPHRRGAAGGGVAALTLVGAAMAGSVDGPLRAGHWVMFAVISLSTLGAMAKALVRPAQPMPVAGLVVVATLFFALGNAILIIPLGWCPAGWRSRRPDATCWRSALPLPFGMPSTRARRCAPTCCARSPAASSRQRCSAVRC
ncbi:hypothetical protein I552_1456 [Mycobacterium xenopi 3993]|nr:hypothetical protein I552_1456 [Mycobacterium xenopi 3993]